MVSDFYLQKHSRDQSRFGFSVRSLLWIVGMLRGNLADELLPYAAPSLESDAVVASDAEQGWRVGAAP